MEEGGKTKRNEKKDEKGGKIRGTKKRWMKTDEDGERGQIGN